MKQKKTVKKPVTDLPAADYVAKFYIQENLDEEIPFSKPGDALACVSARMRAWAELSYTHAEVIRICQGQEICIYRIEGETCYLEVDPKDRDYMIACQFRDAYKETLAVWKRTFSGKPAQAADKGYTQVEKIAYRRFQMYWMLVHDYTLQDIFEVFLESAAEIISNDRSVRELTLENSLEEYGFGGDLYPCMDEFLDTEYEDEALMCRILNKEEFDAYAIERGLSADRVRKRVFDTLHVETPHGIIRAEDKQDPEYPAITLSFIPEGEDPDTYIGPGARIEYSPTYSGKNTPAGEVEAKVIMRYYSKENPDIPAECFEME